MFTGENITWHHQRQGHVLSDLLLGNQRPTVLQLQQSKDIAPAALHAGGAHAPAAPAVGSSPEPCVGSELRPFPSPWDSEGENTFLQGTASTKTAESRAQPDLSGPKET